MFTPTAVSSDAEQGGQLSVQDYVDKKLAVKRGQMAKLKTLEDEEISREFKKIDEEVQRMIEIKKKDFSFDVKEELQNFNEIDEVSEFVDKAIENYKVLRALG